MSSLSSIQTWHFDSKVSKCLEEILLRERLRIELNKRLCFCRAMMYTKNEETHLHVLPQPRYDDEANCPPEDPSSLDQYPDGGWRAWLVVLGAWCALVPAFGIVNTIAVLEEWLSEHQLKDYPKSSVSWIFSLWIFFFYLGGVQVGMLDSLL